MATHARILAWSPRGPRSLAGAAGELARGPPPRAPGAWPPVASVRRRAARGRSRRRNQKGSEKALIDTGVSLEHLALPRSPAKCL